MVSLRQQEGNGDEKPKIGENGECVVTCAETLTKVDPGDPGDVLFRLRLNTESGHKVVHCCFFILSKTEGLLLAPWSSLRYHHAL